MNMSETSIRIEPSWKASLKDEFERPYFKNLSKFVREEYLSGAVYPLPKDLFRAFDMCPFDTVKVVILGQDPYHGAHQANGLCFAVHEGIRLPPSLQNIFKEIQADLSIEPEQNGDLSRWAKQGVLLLNATLTVRASIPGSHQNKGWEEFTDAVIEHLSTEREGLVFILWGNYAKKKGTLIDRTKHLVLESAHPSPFSAYNGFFGCKHFSKANEYLKEKGLKEINWS
jgi:uracil-DNA glycosylase